MRLIELVDKYLENPYKIHTEMHKGYHHPSSASCVIQNEYGETEVAGACMRKVYWEMKGVKRTNPMSARGSRICAYGKAVERFEVEQFKELGIWRDNNVKFINTNYKVSGEADCIVFDKEINGLRGVEIKSGYDYRFRSQVIGTATRAGKPKNEHLMQTMLYVDYFKFPFNILYVDRGNAERGEYEVTLNSDGTPNLDGRKYSIGISVPKIVARFKELDEMLEDNTVPKRDFQKKYSKEKLSKMHGTRRMSKANTEEFEKSGDVDIGDWQCSYCDFKDHCWSGEGKNA